MSFTHLTTTERNELYKLRVTDQLSMSEIGRRMNRSKSTISRELSRNTDECRNVYFPDTAEVKMKARRKKAKVKFQNISVNTIVEVKQRLEQHTAQSRSLFIIAIRQYRRPKNRQTLITTKTTNRNIISFGRRQFK